MFVYKVNLLLHQIALRSTSKNFCSTSDNKWIQQHKPTAAQIYARKHNIMQQKFIINCYKMLQCRQNDSMIQITDKYMILKRQYNDRHFYIPNKKVFLQRIDEAYNKVKEIHEEYNYLQLGKQTGQMTKQEIVNFELQSIQKKIYLDLLNTYEAAFIFMLIIFIITIKLEEIGQKKDHKDKKPMLLTDQIHIFRKIKDKADELANKIKGEVKPLIITEEMELELNKMNITRENSSILRQAKTPKQILQEKKNKSEQLKNQ